MRFLLLLMLLLPYRAEAAPISEPTVYVFWSAEGEQSREAVSFLRSAAIADPKLSVRYFRLDQNQDNTSLLEAVYRRIGVVGMYGVPTILVGTTVLVGFDSAQGAGQSILKCVEQCRKETCMDLVVDLLEGQQAPQVLNDAGPRAVVQFLPSDKSALAADH